MQEQHCFWQLLCCCSAQETTPEETLPDEHAVVSHTDSTPAKPVRNAWEVFESASNNPEVNPHKDNQLVIDSITRTTQGEPGVILPGSITPIKPSDRDSTDKNENLISPRVAGLNVGGRSFARVTDNL